MITPADDLDKIMTVMNTAFDPIYGEAWTRRQVEDALMIGNCQYQLISPQGGEPFPGQIAAGFWMSRFAFDEEELLLLAVAPEFRRKGLGMMLLSGLSVAATTRGAKRLLLEMRAGNDAEALYRSFGFVPIGRRPDYYRMPDGKRIDAITFCCSLK